MISKRKTITATAALLCMLSCSTAFADALDDAKNVPSGISSDGGVQMNRLRNYLERERVNRQIAEDRAAQIAKVEQDEKDKQQQEAAVSFKLKKFIVDKSEVLTEAEIANITAPYEGREVTLQDIYTVVEQINTLYGEKGYATCRAFLPPQTVEDGTIKLLLVEGRTGDYSVIGNTYTKENYIKKRLHLREGEIANVKVLNQDMLLFNATNSTQLRIIMKAGSKPGTTDYEITAYEPKRDNWALFEDNAGSDTSGTYRTGLFFNTKSLSGSCDPFSLGTVLSEGSKAVNATYSHSLGRSGTKMNFLYSTNSVKTVDGDYKDLVKGHANSYVVGFVQPLVVNETTRAEASLDYSYQNSKSNFISFNIVDDTVQDAAFGYALTNYGDSHVFYQKHSYVRGYSKRAPEVGTAENKHFGFYKFNSMYQKAYAAGQSISLRADAQWSGTEGLVSARQFYLGGMYSVRGYKENYLGGDSGFTVNAEYQLPVIKNVLNTFTFFDYGRVYGNEQSDNNILSSVGLGLRGNIGKSCAASLSLGVPLRRDFQTETVSKTRVHFMFSGQF